MENKFNPYPNTQVQDVVLSRKAKVIAYPQFVFNNKLLHEASTQKHLGMFFHFKLTFQEHIENMLNKVNKTESLQQNYKALSLDHH